MNRNSRFKPFRFTLIAAILVMSFMLAYDATAVHTPAELTLVIYDPALGNLYVDDGPNGSARAFNSNQSPPPSFSHIPSN